MNFVGGFLYLIGGVCLFLLGMSYFGSVKTLIFKEQTLSKLNSNFFAYLFGVFSAVVIQSSDAVTILSMDIADNGMLPKRNGIILAEGARLGTTVTALIVSFGELKVTPIIFSVTALASLLLPKKNSTLKSTLFGCSLFFGGLIILELGVNSLGSLIGKLFLNTSNHFLLFLIGLFVTAIVQSSSAVTSILVILLSANSLSLENAIFLLLGSTVGTTITPLIASIKMGKNAKKIAYVYALTAFLSGLLFEILCDFTIDKITFILKKIPKFSLSVFGTFYALTSGILIVIAVVLFEHLSASNLIAKIKSKTL